MSKIQIEKIGIFENNKEGEAYITKTGKNYKKILVTTSKGVIISGSIFSSDDPRTLWKIGDIVDWAVEPREYQGTTYYNFGNFNEKEAKGKYQLLSNRIEVLEKIVAEMQEGLQMITNPTNEPEAQKSTIEPVIPVFQEPLDKVKEDIKNELDDI